MASMNSFALTGPLPQRASRTGMLSSPMMYENIMRSPGSGGQLVEKDLYAGHESTCLLPLNTGFALLLSYRKL